MFLLNRNIHLGKAVESDEIRIVLDSVQRMKIERVIDLGANSGQFALKLLNSGFTGSIQSYEPDPIVLSRLLKSSYKHLDWRVENFAVVGIKDSSQKIKLYRSSNAGYSSSIRKPTKLLTETYTHVKFRKPIEVETTNLCKILSEVENVPIFIKADVQGSERDIFQDLDFQSHLNIKGVILEVSHFEIYEGEWLINEAFNFFIQAGFEMKAFSMEDYSAERGAIQSNLLFERMN